MQSRSPIALGLFSASGVRGGFLPSGGIKMSDVRLLGTNPSRAAVRPKVVKLDNVASGSFGVRSYSRCSPAFWAASTSSSVKNSLPAYLAGRSKGVKLSLVQYPCRSGLPSGVRGVVQDFVFVPAGVFAAVFAAPDEP